MKVVEYGRTPVLPDYVCSKCGANHVKLWRLWPNMTARRQRLLCAECVVSETGDDLRSLDDNGFQRAGRRSLIESFGGMAWAVPSLVDEDGNITAYYAVRAQRGPCSTVMPLAAIQWWQRLPFRCG